MSSLDWKIKPMQEYCFAVKDGTHDSPKKQEFGKLLVTSKNIKNSKLDLSTAYFISKEDFDFVNKRSKVDKNDILISMIGTVGEVCIVQDEPEFAIKNVGLLKCKSEQEAYWLYYYLKTPLAQQRIKERLRGTTQLYLSLGEIRDFPVEYPSDESQMYSTVNLLKTIDDKIELNQRMNETLEAMAQAIFKSWFVDFDPVKAKAEGRTPEGMDATTAALFPSRLTEAGIPEGWRVGRLADFVSLVIDRTKPDNYTASLPYVPIECITSKSVFLNDFQSGDNAQSSLTLFKKGDIIFGAMRPYFHKVCEAPFDGVTRSTAFVLRAKNAKARYFSLFRMYQDDTILFATNNSEGSTIPYAKWGGSLEDMECIVPSDDIMEAFHRTVSPLIARGMSGIQENKTLESARDALLPRLISGKLMISEESV